MTEFTLECSNALENVNLFAEFNGRITPVPKVGGNNRYQVSDRKSKVITMMTLTIKHFFKFTDQLD